MRMMVVQKRRGRARKKRTAMETNEGGRGCVRRVGWEGGTGGRYDQDTLCTHGIVEEYINNK